MDSDAAQRRLLFDPMRLVDGIELSDDPLVMARSAVYAISYERRKKKRVERRPVGLLATALIRCHNSAFV